MHGPAVVHHVGVVARPVGRALLEECGELLVQRVEREAARRVVAAVAGDEVVREELLDGAEDVRGGGRQLGRRAGRQQARLARQHAAHAQQGLSHAWVTASVGQTMAKIVLIN